MSCRWSTRLAAMSAAILMCSSFTQKVSAQDSSNPTEAQADEADELFTKGRALLRDPATLSEACTVLSRSYELHRRGDVLLNLADCHRREGRTATAWREFDEAIRFAQEAEYADAIAVARSYRDSLGRELSELFVDVPKSPPPPEGLVVVLDGKKLPKEQWSVPLFVDPGKHTVTAEAKGHEPFAGEAEVVKAAARSVVVVKLVKLPEAPVPPPPPPKKPAPQPEQEEESSVPTWAWIVGGAGLVMIGGSVAFGIDTVGIGGELDDACNEERTGCPADYASDDAHAHEVRSFGLFVGLGVAGVAATAIAGTAILLEVTGGSANDDVAIAPWASPDGAGVVVGGTTW
jgi:hypothetical protein